MVKNVCLSYLKFTLHYTFLCETALKHRQDGARLYSFSHDKIDRFHHSCNSFSSVCASPSPPAHVVVLHFWLVDFLSILYMYVYDWQPIRGGELRYGWSKSGGYVSKNCGDTYLFCHGVTRVHCTCAHEFFILRKLYLYIKLQPLYRETARDLSG